MNEPEIRYTLREISEASKISAGTLNSRRKALKIDYNPEGYTLDDVKRMLKQPRAKTREYSPRRADALRKRLQNDGALPY